MTQQNPPQASAQQSPVPATSSDRPPSHLSPSDPPTTAPRRLRVSTFLLAVLVLFFAALSFFQWRYIDTLETELQNELDRSAMLQKELASIAN